MWRGVFVSRFGDFLDFCFAGVPLSRERVEELALYDFGAADGNGYMPKFVTSLIEVQAPEGEGLKSVIPGSLQLVSPEEEVHALIIAAARDLQANHSQENCDAWEEVFLSIPACLRRIPAEDLYIKAFNCRQRVYQRHHSLTRTALQLSFEITQFKHKLMALQSKSSLSAEEVAKGYVQAGAEFAKSQEITAGLVTAAEQVQGRLTSEGCLAVFRRFEVAFGPKSFLNSLTNLVVIAKASPDVRVWVMEGLAYLVFEAKAVSNSDITKSTLQSSKGTTGWVQLLEFKFRVLSHFLGTEMGKESFPERDCRVLREHLQDHSTFQRSCEQETWKSQLRGSSQLAFSFLEDMVFGRGFDNSLRMAAKANLGAEGVVLCKHACA